MLFIYILSIFHIFIWSYIIFGSFFGKKHARFIIYYLIPFVYILHILPFHILIELKKKLLNINNDEIFDKKIMEIEYTIPIIGFIMKKFYLINEKLDNYSTFNPISPQGMLILGMIIGIYFV